MGSNRIIAGIICIVTILAISAITISLIIFLKKDEASPEPTNTLECFQVIEDKSYLSYDKETLIVYYLIKQKELGSVYDGYGFSYLAPYISENGNFCKYIDGKIVEVDSTAQNTNN